MKLLEELVCTTALEPSRKHHHTRTPAATENCPPRPFSRDRDDRQSLGKPVHGTLNIVFFALGSANICLPFKTTLSNNASGMP